MNGEKLIYQIVSGIALGIFLLMMWMQCAEAELPARPPISPATKSGREMEMYVDPVIQSSGRSSGGSYVTYDSISIGN